MRTIFTCPVCGGKFLAYASSCKRFCSHKCAYESPERCVAGGHAGTRLYQVWNSMLYRCTNKKCDAWDNYGGRGILVCNEWLSSFLAFRSWALSNGYKETLQIDRRNSDGDYCPDNCRFVTATEQQRNKGKRKSNKSSAYKGVVFRARSSKWVARITVNRRLISIGSFTREEDAARAYDSRTIVEYGAFAKTNFPAVFP